MFQADAETRTYRTLAVSRRIPSRIEFVLVASRRESGVSCILGQLLIVSKYAFGFVA